MREVRVFDSKVLVQVLIPSSLVFKLLLTSLSLSRDVALQAGDGEKGLGVG